MQVLVRPWIKKSNPVSWKWRFYAAKLQLWLSFCSGCNDHVETYYLNENSVTFSICDPSSQMQDFVLRPQSPFHLTFHGSWVWLWLWPYLQPLTVSLPSRHPPTVTTNKMTRQQFYYKYVERLFVHHSTAMQQCLSQPAASRKSL